MTVVKFDVDILTARRAYFFRRLRNRRPLKHFGIDSLPMVLAFRLLQQKRGNSQMWQDAVEAISLLFVIALSILISSCIVGSVIAALRAVSHGSHIQSTKR
jgi:hypothetical protein